MSKYNRSLFLFPSHPPPLPGIYSLHRKNQGSQNWSHTHITGKKNKKNGFGSVLLTISNYLPVKAKVNKFPHIQKGYITKRTAASSDGK